MYCIAVSIKIFNLLKFVRKKCIIYLWCFLNKFFFKDFFLLLLLVLKNVADRKNGFRSTCKTHSERHCIIRVPFNYFCYVKFVLENKSTNVKVPTKSMQLYMLFSNVKTIHTVHSTHVTVQF